MGSVGALWQAGLARGSPGSRGLAAKPEGVSTWC